MTALGNVLGLCISAGLLWLALLAATAMFLSHGADYIIGYGLLSAVFVGLALALLWYLVRERGTL